MRCSTRGVLKEIAWIFDIVRSYIRPEVIVTLTKEEGLSSVDCAQWHPTNCAKGTNQTMIQWKNAKSLVCPFAHLIVTLAPKSTLLSYCLTAPEGSLVPWFGTKPSNQDAVSGHSSFSWNPLYVLNHAFAMEVGSDSYKE